MSLGPEVNLNTLWRSVVHRKYLFALVLFLGMTFTTVSFALLEKQYESEARLFVQLGRSSVGLDPTATTSSTISVMDSRETEIRSIVDLVGSRGVAEEVVRRVGTDRILFSKYDFIELPSVSRILTGDRANTDDPLTVQYSEGRSADQQQAFELAVKKFSQDILSVKSEKKTSVVTIYCKASSPELAKQLADTTVEVSRELHLKISYVAKSNPFFEDEFHRKLQQLESLESEREAFLNERNVLSIEAERSQTQAVIDRLTNQVLDTESELVSLQEELSSLRAELVDTREMVDLPNTGLESLSRSGADQSLIQLKGELADLRTRYKDDHYRIRQLLSRISEVEDEIDKRGETRTENMQRRNPVYESLQLTISQKVALRTAKSRLLEHLKTELADHKKTLVVLNQDQRKASELDRSIDIARAAVYDFAEKRRQSEVLAKLNEQQISNIEVASEGSFVTKHVFPKASLIFPLGLAGSLALAIVLAVVRDQKTVPSDCSTVEVERNVGVPVLVRLPRVRATVRH